MENEQILAVVAVIAVLAVVGRVVINRQQKGGINWPKVVAILFAAAVFVGVMLSVDSYRLTTWLAGSVDEQEDLNQGHVVGREAGAVVDVKTSVGEGLPMFFTLQADSVAATGYYMIKEGEAENATDRQILVSQSDSSRTAIKRTTSTFSITKHPARQADYVPILRLSLPSGEKVLAVMTTYDAANLGSPVVMTSHPLAGKMADIASRQEGVSDMVYVTAFDHAYYAASQTSRLLSAAIVALCATVVAGAAALCIYKKVKK